MKSAWQQHLTLVYCWKQLQWWGK